MPTSTLTSSPSLMTPDAQLMLDTLRTLGGASRESALREDMFARGMVDPAFSAALMLLTWVVAVEIVELGNDSGNPADGRLVLIVGDVAAARTALTALASLPAPQRRRTKKVRDRLSALVVEHDAAEAAAQRSKCDELEDLERSLLRSALVLAQRVAPGMPSTARTSPMIDDYDPRFRVGVGRTEGGMIDGLVEVTIEIDRTTPLRERLVSLSPQLRVTFRAASASPKTVGDAAEYAAAWADAVTLARIVVAASTLVDG